jgi:hypothetical protein
LKAVTQISSRYLNTTAFFRGRRICNFTQIAVHDQTKAYPIVLLSGYFTWPDGPFIWFTDIKWYTVSQPPPPPPPDKSGLFFHKRKIDNISVENDNIYSTVLKIVPKLFQTSRLHNPS